MNKDNGTPLKIIGIRFSRIGKSYYFDASKIDNVEIGDFLIVQTSRGWQIGELSEIVDETKSLKNTSYKPVDRKATEEDLKKRDSILEKNESALKICSELFRESNIEGLKITSADYSFDEKILSILYSNTTDETPNLEIIRSKIHNEIKNTRIDFHKIGPRDSAKYYGGIGACGMECRCCTRFIDHFESISIRMAKKQGISLNPSDITGMCDRLRCCLGYEYCHYDEAMKHLPRRNKLVSTPLGKGKVRDLAPLTNHVFVYLEDYGVRKFDSSEVEEITEDKPQTPNNNQRSRRNRGKQAQK